MTKHPNAALELTLPSSGHRGTMPLDHPDPNPIRCSQLPRRVGRRRRWQRGLPLVDVPHHPLPEDGTVSLPLLDIQM